MTRTSSAWIALDGAVNARDLGGTPLSDGRRVRAHRLIRSDNLQSLSDADVRRLVDGYGVRRVADLRTGVEMRSEGPGPLTREPDVTVEHLSLFPESATAVDVVPSEDGPIVLPWQDRDARTERRDAGDVYLGYIADRPDSVLAALRLIAHPDGGATIVHCAAGKDRTGVVVAIALSAVGVPDEAVITDYARTAERITPLLARLAASPTYANDISVLDPDRHTPKPETMEHFLGGLDEHFGGARGWLSAQGWTDADQHALEAALVEG